MVTFVGSGGRQQPESRPGVTVRRLWMGMPEAPTPASPALNEGVPDADRVEPALGLQPTSPYRWVHDVGSPILIHVSVGAAAHGDRALLTCWDCENRPVYRMACSRPETRDVAFDVAGRGAYMLTLDLFDGSKCTARLIRSFCVCPANQALQAVWRKSEFQPGCCSFPGRQNWTNGFGTGHPKDIDDQAARTLDADLAARLGMTIVRPDLPAAMTGPGRPIDFGLTDLCMKTWTDRGFRLSLQVGPPGETDWAVLPRYAHVTDAKWRYPHDEKTIREFAEAVIARYAGDCEFVEVYNEPDNDDFWRGTVAEFVAMHKTIFEAARKTAPNTRVITGGLCLVDPVRSGQIARLVRSYVDAVGYHSHGGVDNLAAAMTAMKATHAAAGYENPVFYNTETGYANWRPDQERSSASAIVQKLVYCWAHGNRCALVYASREYGGPRGSGDWGMLDYTFCPRFSYGAVASFCDWFAGAKFVAALSEQNSLYVYEFRKGDSILAPVFISWDGRVPIKLETDAHEAFLVDPMGNRAPAKVENGRVEVLAGLYPQAIVLQGATRLAIAK
jgi:hypothetical protein